MLAPLVCSQGVNGREHQIAVIFRTRNPQLLFVLFIVFVGIFVLNSLLLLIAHLRGLGLQVAFNSGLHYSAVDPVLVMPQRLVGEEVAPADGAEAPATLCRRHHFLIVLFDTVQVKVHEAATAHATVSAAPHAFHAALPFVPVEL